VTAPKGKSAITVVKSAISPVIAHPRPPVSALATSASNLAMSRLNALCNSTPRTRRMIYIEAQYFNSEKTLRREVYPEHLERVAVDLRIRKKDFFV
jgi:hypothetical protein